MAHRDDHAAALARADALARDLARERKRAEKAERALAALKAKPVERVTIVREPSPPAPQPAKLPIENLADRSESTGMTVGAFFIVVAMLGAIAAIVVAVARAIR